NRCPADGGVTPESGTFPGKVIVPPVASRVEQGDEGATLWIKPRHVRALARVAARTRQAEIVPQRPPVVLLSADVIDLMREYCAVLRHLTVFTPAPCPLPHLAASRLGHGSRRARRALKGQPSLCLKQIEELSDAQVLFQHQALIGCDGATVVLPQELAD